MIMWQHCGCSVEVMDENREVRGCLIITIRLDYGDKRNILIMKV